MAACPRHALAMAAGLLAASVVPGPARAYTTTGTILVSVTIPKACTFSVTNMGFGVYASAQLDAAGTVTVTCTSTTGYQIGINVGAHSSTAYSWNMAGPSGALLAYQVYKNPDRSTYWGGTQNFDTVTGAGAGVAQTISAYGRIAAGQYVAAGAYTDTITFTLYY